MVASIIIDYTLKWSKLKIADNWQPPAKISKHQSHVISRFRPFGIHSSTKHVEISFSKLIPAVVKRVQNLE